MTSANERSGRKMRIPRTRHRSLLGSTRGSRVGFGGPPKQSFRSEKFAKAGRVRSSEIRSRDRLTIIALRYGDPVGAGIGVGEPKLKFTVGAFSAPCCAAKNGFC